MKKKILAILAVMMIFALIFTGCGSKDKKGEGTSGDNPQKVYEDISENLSGLKSAEYTADQVTKIDFSDTDQRKTLTSLKVQEVYKDDSLDYHMNVSYKGNTSVTDYDVFYTDGKLYSDMTDEKICEAKTPDEFTSGSMAITNPLMYLQQNALFNIAKDDMVDLTATEQENDSNGKKDKILSFKVADEKITKYLDYTIDEEEAIYTEDMNFSNLSVKIKYDNKHYPLQVKVKCNLAVADGEGTISWTYDFDAFDELTEISFPDFSGYKTMK